MRAKVHLAKYLKVLEFMLFNAQNAFIISSDDAQVTCILRVLTYFNATKTKEAEKKKEN